MHRWPRTLFIKIRLPHEARGLRAMARRHAMQDLYLNGGSDGNGGPVHLSPSEAAYEVHPLVQDTDADGTAYAIVYAGDEDPIELTLREPVIREAMDVDPNWQARRRELGELFASEVMR